MILVLPVRFENKTTGNFINTERFLPVNNVFGHFIESVNIYKKDDLTRIAPPLPSGSVGRYMTTILQHMADEQLKVLERDILYAKTPVVGTNIENRINRLGDTANYDHFQDRINKFARRNAGQEGEYQAAYARDVNIESLIWRNNKHVIPLRFLHHFFAVPLEMDVSLNLKFDLETNMSKLFEFIGNAANANEREDIDTTAPDIQVTFFETPTIKYFLYEHTPAEAARKAITLSQMKAFRTGVQPVYHEKQVIINAAALGGHLNFNNTGTQFEWIII